MQQTVEHSPHAPSFAGLLASLATAGHRRHPSWEEEELADDVASLSYERALRTHARYRPAVSAERTAVEAGPVSGDLLAGPQEDSDRLRIFEAELNQSPSAESEPELASATEPPADQPLSGWHHDPEAERTTAKYVPTDAAIGGDTARFAAAARNLKSASITIRLSEAECRQLRERAATAGLTVSAYLRSCTLEAESLRAMVKDTLAQLRSAPASEHPQPGAAQPEVQPRSWRQWLQKLLLHPRLHRRLTQRIAQT
jgi:hypothetical protein